MGVAADADAEELFPSMGMYTHALSPRNNQSLVVTESYTRLPTSPPSSHFIATTSSMMTAS